MSSRLVTRFIITASRSGRIVAHNQSKLLLWRGLSTDSITYSGGQASKGQGGFYGSGGARAMPAEEGNPSSDQERQRMIALAADVQHIQTVMEELVVLENLLRSEGEDNVSSKSIELKASIKKLMTDPTVVESLNRLELEGQPVWGLSSEEREMIVMAREKVNDC